MKLKSRISSSSFDLFPVRLNKYISSAGYCSRRKADEYIKNGNVSVNGKVIKEVGYIVDAPDVLVTVNNNRLTLYQKHYYILLNKPKDYISTVSDERGRKTVLDLIQFHNIPRLYPVGRLDRNTTGVLLLTNDGGLACFLTHPSSVISKEYFVVLDRSISGSDFNKLRSGIKIDNTVFKASNIFLNENNPKNIIISLHYGKYHIVRKMFESLSYNIESLDRISFAGIRKKGLLRGKWRFLTEGEIKHLKGLMRKKRKNNISIHYQHKLI